jgi:hypothetical protein
MDNKLKNTFKRRDLLRGLLLLFAVGMVQAVHAKADQGFVDMTPELDDEDEKEKAEQEKADEASDAENNPSEEDNDREPANDDDVAGSDTDSEPDKKDFGK